MCLLTTFQTFSCLGFIVLLKIHQVLDFIVFGIIVFQLYLIQFRMNSLESLLSLIVMGQNQWDVLELESNRIERISN